jgi:hypothetical protein
MSYAFVPGALYRMPTHFGPTPGPRQIPEGRQYDPTQSPKRRLATVSVGTDRDALNALLPPGLNVPEDADAVLTVEHSAYSEIDWLAGRGYSTLGVKFPAEFHGREGTVRGQFLAVLWENLADPILSGRDELGFNKIWCELPDPRVYEGRHVFEAHWLGFTFFRLELSELRPVSPSLNGAAPAAPPAGAGVLHYKYIPRTGAPGVADAAYMTLTPAEQPTMRVVERRDGAGRFSFTPATFDDMPTQYRIVSALASLPLGPVRHAALAWTVGGKDLSDQRILA